MPRGTQSTAHAAEDEEEYEPDFEPEDAEQIHNKLDGLPPTDLAFQRGPSTSLAPYKLPEAPPLTEQEVQKYGDMTVHRAFGMLSSVDDTQKSKVAKGGFNRLAASDYGRDAWVTILSRLATRASAGLEDPQEVLKMSTQSITPKEAALSAILFATACTTTSSPTGKGGSMSLPSG